MLAAAATTVAGSGSTAGVPGVAGRAGVLPEAELAGKGGYWLIPDHLHAPLEQGFVITKRAESNALAQQFADYMGSKAARAVMTRYGFVLPGEAAGK